MSLTLAYLSWQIDVINSRDVFLALGIEFETGCDNRYGSFPRVDHIDSNLQFGFWPNEHPAICFDS